MKRPWLNPRSWSPSHRLLLLLATLNMSNFFNRQLLAPLVEPIKAYFSLSDAQVGGLNSAFEIAYPLASVALAVLADRGIRKRVIALGVVVWSVASVVTGMAGSYLVLLLARVGLGIGCGGYGPVGMAVLSDAFPSSKRSRAVSIHDSGLMVGAALGFLLGGMLGEAFGWRVPFLVAGIPGLVLAWAAWQINEPERGASELKSLGLDVNPDADREPLDLSLATWRMLFRIPSLRAVYLANVLIAFATGGLVFWLPTFLVRIHGFSLGQAGLASGLLQVIAGLIGILSGGWLADRWVQHHPGGRLLTLGIGFLVGTPFAIMAVMTTNLYLFVSATAIAVICYTVYFPCVGPQVHDVTRPVLRATALAVNILLGHVLGNSLSAPFIGWLSDQMGDLRLALLAVPIVAVAGGVVALVGARHVGRDRQTMLRQLISQ